MKKYNNNSYKINKLFKNNKVETKVFQKTTTMKLYNKTKNYKIYKEKKIILNQNQKMQKILIRKIMKYNKNYFWKFKIIKNKVRNNMIIIKDYNNK